jgi:intracellular multiplication protein IcmX
MIIKTNRAIISLVAIMSISQPATAQYNTAITALSGGTSNPEMKKLVKYLKNMGMYFGYQINEQPGQAPSSELLDKAATQVIQSYAMTTFLGSLPVNAISTAFSKFVPDSSNYNQINAFANSTFNQGGSGAGGNPAFIQPLIDQQTYQQDPVSQSVLNILATPDMSFCLSNDKKSFQSNCSFMYKDLVSAGVIGNMNQTPNPQDFFNYSNYIKNFLPQLNSNTLISPLWYDTSSTQSDTSSSSQGAAQEGKGLTASNQQQNAANFINYVTDAVTPIPLANKTDYSDAYNKAKGLTKVTPLEQAQAQYRLDNYLASLRAYASKASVVMGNIYYIYGKRLVQKQGTSSAAPETSQAMSEFTMATNRLYNPSQSQNGQQWIDKINSASPATVQKEIAILLAEINYQMYLSRQQDERLLLTNSILLLQNIKQTLPDPTQLKAGQD